MTDDSIPEDEAARKTKEKKSAYDREYNLKNRDKKRAQRLARMVRDPEGEKEKARTRNNAWAARNREKNRARDAARRAKNIEKVRADSNASYHRNKAKNKQKLKARDAKKYIADKAAMNARRMQHAKDNPEQKRASDQRYYWKNPEKHRASAMDRHYANWPHKYEVQKLYALMNKERVSRHRRAVISKRRMRLRASSEHYTGKDVEALEILQKFKCVYCRVSIEKIYHVDHIMPLAKGGDNSRYNIQLLCPKCNKRKAAKHPDDFIKEFKQRR